MEVLRGISEDELLRERLGFKGGTALSKLHFGGSGRLSVDLDFNVLGSRSEVQGLRAELRSRLIPVVRYACPGSRIRHRHSWEMLGVEARYQPVSGSEPQVLKVELSMVERFPITRTEIYPLDLPSGGRAQVRSYPVDELVSTKLRALFSRSKGRDLYDLDLARPLLRDPGLVRRMAVYYFYRSRIAYDPEVFAANVAEKLASPAFVRDARPFLRTDTTWDAGLAARRFPERYSFMSEISAGESGFISRARSMLDPSGRGEVTIAADARPLSELFGGLPEVSARALEATVEDIRVWPSRPRWR